MKNRKSMRVRRTRQTRRSRRGSRRTRQISRYCRHGGSLGSIPRSAIVSIQQDPYSARILVDADTAEAIFDARGPTQL